MPEGNQGPGLPYFYPSRLMEEIDLSQDESTYGAPDPKTLALFTGQLAAGARILDVAGGDGRYALPLAEAGYEVTILDVHEPSLEAAQRKAAELPEDAGTVHTICGDILEGTELFQPGSYDGSLNAGFIYLAPPATAKEIFNRSATFLKVGGLAVVEFNTDRVRQDKTGRDLIGLDEHRYTTQEGQETVAAMFGNGFRNVQQVLSRVHHDEPFYVDANVIIASGRRL